MNAQIEGKSHMVTVKMADGRELDVDPNGNVYQPTRSRSYDLDEARLQASDTYLAEARIRGLTKAQHAYWGAVRQKTDLAKNFARPDSVRR